MNNQFLNHLRSITPQGRAEETKMFVPAKDIKEATLKKALMTGDKVARQKASYRQSRLNAQRRNAQDVVDPNVSPFHPDYPLVDRPATGTMSSDKLAANAQANYRHYAPSSYGKKLDRGNAAMRAKDAEKNSWKRDEVKAKEQKNKRREKALAAIGKAKPKPKGQVSEATRSKYLKALYGSKGMFDRTGIEKTHQKQLERRAAMLRRGGADPEVVRGEINRIAAQNRNDPKAFAPRDYRADTASYNFDSKAQRSREDGKKSPRTKAVTESKTVGKKKAKAMLKSTGKQIKRVGGKILRALSTPQASVDAMITGRNF